MTQYKTVAGPAALSIEKGQSYANAVNTYADIINREAAGGWVLDCIQEIPVTQKAGCLAGIFGAKDTTVYFNMLVFRRDA